MPFPFLLTSSSLLSPLSFYLFLPPLLIPQHPLISTNAVTSFHPYFSPPPPSLSFCISLFSCALFLTASESVLLQHLFQSKLTQTGSLVPAAQGRAGLKGPKVALLLHKMPSNTVLQQPRRHLDLTKVQNSVINPAVAMVKMHLIIKGCWSHVVSFGVKGPLFILAFKTRL